MERKGMVGEENPLIKIIYLVNLLVTSFIYYSKGNVVRYLASVDWY